MLPHSIFDSALLKIERADQHIRDLQAAFKSFTDHHRHTVHVHGNKNGPLFFEIIFDAPLPPSLPLILSDAIHNLSTALDHATWELMRYDGGVRDRTTKLPTGNNGVNFEAACKGIKTSQQSTTDFFVQLEIYPQGGGEQLYWLRQLDNADKHTILLPVAQAANVERIEFFDIADGTRWERENVALHPGADGRSFIEIEPGIGIDCNKHFKTTGGIFFGDVQGVPNEPVIPTLVHFRDAVTNTLTEFRRLAVEYNPGIPRSLRDNLLG